VAAAGLERAWVHKVALVMVFDRACRLEGLHPRRHPGFLVVVFVMVVVGRGQAAAPGRRLA